MGSHRSPGGGAPPRTGFTLTGPSRDHDPRTVAIRADLADVAVAAHHFAPHYAAPLPMAVVGRPTLRTAPGDTAETIRQLATGEAFALLDSTAGWSWGYAVADHLVGYVADDALMPAVEGVSP